MAPEAICSVPIRGLDPAGSPLALLLKAVGTGEGLVHEVWEGLQRAGEAGGSQTVTLSLTASTQPTAAPSFSQPAFDAHWLQNALCREVGSEALSMSGSFPSHPTLMNPPLSNNFSRRPGLEFLKPPVLFTSLRLAVLPHRHALPFWHNGYRA